MVIQIVLIQMQPFILLLKNYVMVNITIVIILTILLKGLQIMKQILMGTVMSSASMMAVTGRVQNLPQVTLIVKILLIRFSLAMQRFVTVVLITVLILSKVPLKELYQIVSVQKIVK